MKVGLGVFFFGRVAWLLVPFVVANEWQERILVRTTASTPSAPQKKQKKKSGEQNAEQGG